jgi:hypothetical protein
MQAIISHDVDHITVWEHYNDLIIPKFLIRAKLELLTGKISFKEYFLRIGDLLKNNWNGLDELMDFNTAMRVDATFFVAVNSGMQLNYTFDNAAFWINKIKQNGFEVGVHGIDYTTINLIKSEYERFSKVVNNSDFGIRMHYLRDNTDTFTHMADIGYAFDCTRVEFKNPYKIKRMWEFPFQIMDGWIMDGTKRYQINNLEKAKTETLKLIDKAFAQNLMYLSVDFHDRYFSNSFKTWKDWYIWLIEWLTTNKIGFTNYKKAIAELENKSI